MNVGYRNTRGRRAAMQAAESVKRTFSFDAMTISIAPQAIDHLRRNPTIRYVEHNGRMWPIGQTTPYGVRQVSADITINNGETASGVSIAILDTGIDATHEDLKTNIGQGIDCGGSRCREAVADDDRSHGTHVAGTAGAVDNDLGVLGVAPAVTLHSVKVLGDDGGTYDAVAAGIEASADAGHDVQNMSFGGGHSDLVTDAMRYAASKGVVMVAAAGNSGSCSDCVIFPAAAPETIAVSATDQNDDLASFSSSGPEIDLAAPGVDVLSTVPDDRYAYASGTSMAAPHVSAAAAVLIASGVTDRETVRETLKESADDIGLTAARQGAGRLNVASAVELSNNADKESGDDTDEESSGGTDDTDDDSGDETDDETETEETAPTITQLSVRTRTTGPWFRAETAWAVADESGALETVASQLLADGSVVDSETSTVNGSTASGDHQTRTRGAADQIRLVVTAESGLSAIETIDLS